LSCVCQNRPRCTNQQRLLEERRGIVSEARQSNCTLAQQSAEKSVFRYEGCLERNRVGKGMTPLDVRSATARCPCCAMGTEPLAIAYFFPQPGYEDYLRDTSRRTLFSILSNRHTEVASRAA
jgi:hypothetical protein